MKVLKVIVAIFVWFSLSLPGVSLYSQRIHSKKVYLSTLIAAFIIGPAFTIVEGLIYLSINKTCVLHCGDK